MLQNKSLQRSKGKFLISFREIAKFPSPPTISRRMGF